MAISQVIRQIEDLVKETTASTGTGAITLAGAVTGFRTFVSAYGNLYPVYYAIKFGTEWEIGWGQLSGSTLIRNKVFASSNSGALVNFSAGTKTVYGNNSGQLILDSFKQTYSAQTTDATETILYAYGVSEFEPIVLPNTSLAVHITFVARQTAGAAGTVGDSYTSKYSALFETTSTTRVLVSGPTEVTGYSHKDAAFGGTIDLTANDVLYTFQIKVTGEVNKTIEWKAYVEFFEVG